MNSGALNIKLGYDNISNATKQQSGFAGEILKRSTKASTLVRLTTHHHQFSAQQAPNSHSIRKCSWKADCIATSAVFLALVRSGSRPYVPTVHGRAAHSGALAVGMLESRYPSVVLHSQSEPSRPTPRRCWRSLGPIFRALGAHLNNNTSGGPR